MTSAIEFRNAIFGGGNGNAGLATRLLDLIDTKTLMHAKPRRSRNEETFQKCICQLKTQFEVQYNIYVFALKPPSWMYNKYAVFVRTYL